MFNLEGIIEAVPGGFEVHGDVSAISKLHTLIELCDHNEALYKHCSQRVRDSSWNEIINSPVEMDKRLSLNYSLDYGLSPQQEVASFDLLAGLYYYDKGIHQLSQHNVRAFQTLSLSSDKYHFFHAALVLSNLALDEIKYKLLAGESITTDLEAMFLRMRRMIDRHGAPAYAQSAYIYYALNALTGEAHYLDSCLKQINLACEFEPVCHAEMHNAYFGRGFGAHSNLDIKTLVEAKVFYNDVHQSSETVSANYPKI